MYIHVLMKVYTYIYLYIHTYVYVYTYVSLVVLAWPAASGQSRIPVTYFTFCAGAVRPCCVIIISTISTIICIIIML